MMGILEAKAVTIQIEKKEILKQVSLSIAEGKRTVIIGPNGSGKSTLLKALAGLSKCTVGQILFEAQDIHCFGKKKLAQKLAILPQGASVPTDLTVRELVDYGRFPHRKWWSGVSREDKTYVRAALKETGMEPFKDRLVSTLSGGERQRAWVAMALAQSPKVLLLDEPTTYLDIAHQLEVMQIVARLNEKNQISIVMVLHDINHAMRYADEVVVIKDGMIFASGPPQKVITVNMLENVFGVTADLFTNRRGISVLSPTHLKEK